MTNTSRIILALDRISIKEAGKIAKKLRKHVAGGKANDLIDEVGAGCLMGMDFSLKMLDPKIHDTPDTNDNRMSKYKGKADFVTVHASCSLAALKKTAARATSCNIKAIAVTVTTDIETGECISIFGKGNKKKVLQFVRRAKGAKLHGIVCSALEVKAVRAAWPAAIIIVPAVRSSGSAVHDQKRVGTPYQAILDGADYIVVGRQVLDKKKGKQMVSEAKRINKETDKALFDLIDSAL